MEDLIKKLEERYQHILDTRKRICESYDGLAGRIKAVIEKLKDCHQVKKTGKRDEGCSCEIKINDLSSCYTYSNEIDSFKKIEDLKKKHEVWCKFLPHPSCEEVKREIECGNYKRPEEPFKDTNVGAYACVLSKKEDLERIKEDIENVIQKKIQCFVLLQSDGNNKENIQHVKNFYDETTKRLSGTCQDRNDTIAGSKSIPKKPQTISVESVEGLYTHLSEFEDGGFIFKPANSFPMIERKFDNIRYIKKKEEVKPEQEMPIILYIESMDTIDYIKNDIIGLYKMSVDFSIYCNTSKLDKSEFDKELNEILNRC